MTHIRQAWKAVVAFFAPGLLLVAERVLLTDGDVDGTLLRRALIVGAATSVVVWATRNGPSPDPTTSTPERLPGDAGETLLHVIVGALVIALLAALVVIAWSEALLRV